jgi:hypothetical protein
MSEMLPERKVRVAPFDAGTISGGVEVVTTHRINVSVVPIPILAGDYVELIVNGRVVKRYSSWQAERAVLVIEDTRP